jgi:hypothetical protein
MYSTLSSMHLPAALDTFEKPTGLPETTLKQSLQVKNEGGVKSLYDGLENLFSYENVIHRKLAAIVQSLDEVDPNKQDRTGKLPLSSSYVNPSSSWVSHQMLQDLNQEANNYRNLIQKAMDSNQLVKERLESHLSYIQRLSDATPQELEAKIPPHESSTMAWLSTHASLLKELRELLNTSTTQLKDRDILAMNLRRTQEHDNIGKSSSLRTNTPFSALICMASYCFML